MPRHDMKCPKCNKVEEHYLSMADMADDHGSKAVMCVGCDEYMTVYFGAPGAKNVTVIYTGVQKLGDLMATDSFNRDHERPKEWFAEQTKKKQAETSRKECERLTQTGQLKKANEFRKRIGLHEL